MNSMMRNVILAAGAIVLGAATAGASPDMIFEGNVPVPFVINGMTFPAGKYMVERESSSVLLIRGEKNNHVAAFVATLPDDRRDPAGDQPALMLKEIEGKYRLAGIWESSRAGWDIVTENR